MSGILKFLGLALLVGGIAILFMVYSPIIRQEMRYQTLQSQSRNEIEQEVIPQSLDFGLVIPKIGVNTIVFEQVNPNDPDEYLPLLSQGVAQSEGSAFPGEEGAVFLFAHSADSPLNVTRYNAVFYLLNKLEASDKIEIYYRRVKHEYQVIEKRIVAPELVNEYLVTKDDQRKLILQTCHPAGTTINRLLVIAEEV